MKATTLSFLAKYGASEADRLVLGHHADTSGSLAVYSRDLQAKPLRALDQCLDAIRRKVFLPDVSRSGYFVVDRGIVGRDEALGPAQGTDESGLPAACELFLLEYVLRHLDEKCMESFRRLPTH
ncbi:unnamed protein product, partial [Symbiodinium microadriaticum]